MPDFFNEFLSWYLAPWRRIGRKEFGIALTVATIPGILFMLLGWGNSAGSFIEPLMNLTNLSQPVGNMELENNPADREIGVDALKNVGFAPQVGFTPKMNNPFAAQPKMAEPVPTPKDNGVGFDWSGLINGLCLLAMIPLSRMRLRDMGWFGWQEMILTVLFNISVVEGLIQSLTGFDILPMGMLWSSLNFAGYAWLTFAKGKERAAVFERVPEVWEDCAKPDETPIRKRDYDDEY